MGTTGMFITFEGGEGSGKTTLLQNLADHFKKEKIPFILTREPGGTPLGNTLRQILLQHNSDIHIGQEAELLLFLASRAQHLEEVIRPALSQGKIILCDRFNDSSIAYQGVARGLGYEKVKKLCNEVCEGTQPDLTFFLDIDPKTGLQRTKRLHKEDANAGETDRIESEKIVFHEQLREGFLHLARDNPKRIVTIDANKSIEQVFDEALKIIESRIRDIKINAQSL